MKNVFPKIVSTAVAATTVGFLVVGAMVLTSPRAHADSKADTKAEDLAEIGLSIAPVKLTYKPENRELVGLGSFIVNAQADCNGCHTSNPATEYQAGGNPYSNQHPTAVNAATYLAGGQDFGPVGGGISNGKAGPGPDIISRNLTPDKTGLPAGGISFANFLTIMRSGTDLDHAHLNCSSSVTNNCYFPPADGALLQVMPWPAFSHMTPPAWALPVRLISCTTTAATSSPVPPPARITLGP
jgi:hypothetical protein